MYYRFKNYLKKYKLIKQYPLYIKKKNKTLRAFVDEIAKNLVKKKTSQILKEKNFREISNFFNEKYISLFFYYYFYKKIYTKVANQEILKHIKKKKIKTNFFQNDLIDYLYSFKVLTKLLLYLLQSLFKNTNEDKFAKTDILVNYTFGNTKNSRKDFPYYKRIKKNTKITYFLSQGVPMKNKYFDNTIEYISRKKIKGFEHKPIYFNSHTSKFYKVIKFSLKKFIKNPLIFSLFIDFAINYDYFYQLCKSLNVKIYINGDEDPNLAPYRQALKELNGKNLSFQRSYTCSKASAFLQLTNDVVFTWGKNNFLSKGDNLIDKSFTIDPIYFRGIKNKTKNKKKIITVFGSSFYDTSYMSPEIYNKFLKVILDEVISSENNLFVKLRLKYPSHKEFFNKKNYEIIKNLIKEKKLALYTDPLNNNANMIINSDLIISIHTITPSSEALINGIDTVCLCNSSYSKKFVKEINKIYPFIYYDLKNFKKNLKLKLKFKKSHKKLKKINHFFYEKNISKVKPEVYIDNFLKNYRYQSR